jgi:hypothetical protein
VSSTVAATPKKISVPANIMTWFQARNQGDGWSNQVWYKTKVKGLYGDDVGSGGRPAITDANHRLAVAWAAAAAKIGGGIENWPPNKRMPNSASVPKDKRYKNIEGPKESQVPNYYFDQVMQYYHTFHKYLDTKTRKEGDYNPKTAGGVRQIAGLVLQDPGMLANKYLRFGSILEPTDAVGRQYTTVAENIHPRFPKGSGVGCFQTDPYNYGRTDVSSKANPSVPCWVRPGVNPRDPRGDDAEEVEHQFDIVTTLNKMATEYNDELKKLDLANRDETYESTAATRKRLLLPWVIEYYIRPLWDPKSRLFMGNPDSPNEGGPEIGFVLNPGPSDHRWTYYGWQGKESVIPDIYDRKSEGCTGTKCPEYAFRGGTYSYPPPNAGTEGTAGYVASMSDPWYFRGPAGLKMPGVEGAVKPTNKPDDRPGPAFTNWDRDLTKEACEAAGVPVPGSTLYMEPSGLGSDQYVPWAGGKDAAKTMGGGTGLYTLRGYEETENPLGEPWKSSGGKGGPSDAPKQSKQGTENFPTVNPCNNLYQAFHYLSDLNACLLDNGDDGLCPWNKAGRILSVSIIDTEGGGDGWQQSAPIGRVPPQGTYPSIIKFDKCDLRNIPQPKNASHSDGSPYTLEIIVADATHPANTKVVAKALWGGFVSDKDQTKMGIKFVDPKYMPSGTESVKGHRLRIYADKDAFPGEDQPYVDLKKVEVIAEDAGMGLKETYGVVQSWNKLIGAEEKPFVPEPARRVPGNGKGCGIPGWDTDVSPGTRPPRIPGIEESVNIDSQWHDGRTVKQTQMPGAPGGTIVFTRGFRARMTQQDYVSALWYAFTPDGIFGGNLPPLNASKGNTSPVKELADGTAVAYGKLGFTSSTSTHAGSGSQCRVYSKIVGGKEDKSSPCKYLYNPSYDPDAYWPPGCAFTIGSKEIYNVATGTCELSVPQPPNGNPYPTCCTPECGTQRPGHSDINPNIRSETTGEIGLPYDTKEASIYMGAMKESKNLYDPISQKHISMAQYLWNSFGAWALNATPEKPLKDFTPERLYQKNCNYVMFSNENDNDPASFGGIFNVGNIQREEGIYYEKGFNTNFGGGGMMLGGWALSDLMEFIGLVSTNMKSDDGHANIALYDMGFTPGTWFNEPLSESGNNPLGLPKFDLTKSYYPPK